MMQAPFASVLDRPRRQPDECLLRTLEIVHARFVVECRAAGVEAIDCLCTFRDARCCGRRALRDEVPIYAVTKLLATLNDHWRTTPPMRPMNLRHRRTIEEAAIAIGRIDNA
jgi:hypothetical protein